MNNDNNFQPAPAADPAQPQVAPAANNFSEPVASPVSPVVPPVPQTPSFGTTPVEPQPVQPQPVVQPAPQPAARKTGAPVWMWIMLGVVVVLVGGAIAAVLLIK